MNKKLDIVAHLYDQPLDEATLQALLEDEALRQEYEALRAVQAALEARPAPVARPEAAVLSRIMAAAAADAPPVVPLRHAARRDRAPHRRRALWAGLASVQVLRYASAAVAAVLVMALGVWQWTTPIPMADQAAPESLAETQAAPLAPETRAAPLAPVPPAETDAAVLADLPPPPPPDLLPAPPLSERAGIRSLAAQSKAVESLDVPSLDAASFGAEAELRDALAAAPSAKVAPHSAQKDGQTDIQKAVAAALAADAADLAALSWDDAEDVRVLHRRIARLQARNQGETWDASVAPLEQLSGAPLQGVQPATTRRPPPKQ